MSFLEKARGKTRELLKLYFRYGSIVYDVAKYAIVSSIILSLVSYLLNQLSLFLLKTAGRVAISTGDFTFLFKTWQRPLLLMIGIGVLFMYVALDLNSQIIYSDQILRGRPKLFEALKKGFLSIKEFFTPDGLGIILYIALIAPLIGFGFTISLTDSLYVPDFISSVIDSVLVYRILYYLALAAFVFVGVIHIFILHGILLGGLKSYHADNESRELLPKNCKDFLMAHVKLLGPLLGAFILIFIIFEFIPGVLFHFLVKDEEVLQNLELALRMTSSLGSLTVSSLFKTFYMIRMTQLYYQYKGEEIKFRPRTPKWKAILSLMTVIIVYAFVFAFSYAFSMFFDEIYDTRISTQIIAHRAGGVEAPENTVTGIEKAIELGAYGAEIDIQRTKDGYYIVNHDSSFSRLCNNKAKPEDLTLDEVKDLIIRDPNFPNMEEDVATFEEMLDASKDKIILFVELKGNTADEQMAEDAVRIIKEKGMEKQCVLISLKYPLINYIETKYPEMDTAYLTFASFGNTQNLNCDYLGLEEEAASVRIISMIHESGKKVMVWTPNSLESQKKFLISEADYIITDKVLQADNMIEELKRRDRIDVILDAINYAQ